MEFDDHKSIYMQLVDLLCEQILTNKWPAEEKIPSVRDMGMMVQVNPNTVLRAYDFLQQKNIVFNKRGIGYFVEKEAVDRILDYKREDFFETALPRVFKSMQLLKITPDEFLQRFTTYSTSSEPKDTSSQL